MTGGIMDTNYYEHFGAMSFNKKKMRERLPYPIYLKWKNAIRNEESLDRETADAIAHAMKEWAIENGATHYCHWFQPLNGLTAKKHDAFLDRTDRQEAIYRFSGKELIKGESDGSSFPSGGMRSTFEARGYTYWDATANSFIIDRILYIPTIFVSYNGEKLDKKAPLLESMNLLSKYGSKVVNLFEKKEFTYRMKTKVGLEQEFFLIDLDLYNQRSDLKSCGRTLVGAGAPKGQEMDDHYFGSIPRRVMEFYEDLNEKLWALGVYAKTEHNEVAPGQYELVVLFENVNISVDYNQLLMSLLKRVARDHGLACLLHEKPFAGINGSGKHNNYSLSTNYGLNVFDPGKDPENNIVFLLFMAAMIEAVDDYAPLLRVASSGPSNDYRLGGLEAPPAIISIFLGNDLEELFMDLAHEEYTAKKPNLNPLKINSLGYTPRDTSDRNRTSPFAFTGNKFEFRMLGSSNSSADSNIVINTILAHSLRKMYDQLKEYDGSHLLEDKARDLVRQIILKHERILYSKDNYSQEWVNEAQKRGLPNLATYYEAIHSWLDKDLMDIFSEYDIFSETEARALYEIGLETIANYHSLEAKAFLTMLTKDVEPAVMKELQGLVQLNAALQNKGIQLRIDILNKELEDLMMRHHSLRDEYRKTYTMETEERASYLQKEVVPQMIEIRKIADLLESMTSRENWTIPTYEDIFTALE